MNVGFFFRGDWFPPVAGSRVHAHQLTSKLVGRGHTVSVIASDCHAPYLTRYRGRELPRFLRDVDLLYIRVHPSWEPDRYTLLKLLSRRLPVVWQINAPLEEQLLSGSSPVELAWHRRLGRWLARLVNACVCNTEALSDYVREVYGIHNEFVVPLGSDPKLFSPEKRISGFYHQNGGDFSVVWAGTAQYEWHALDLIADVARRVAARDPDVRFVLIGKLSAIKRRLSEAATMTNVILIGEKPYFDMPRLLAAADVGLCLYADPAAGVAQTYRSPLKLFDYMASGLPSIATAGGQVTRVIETSRCGWLVGGDPEEIAARILELKRRPELRRRMGLAGRRAVERHYNWDRVARDTEQALSSLV